MRITKRGYRILSMTILALLTSVSCTSDKFEENLTEEHVEEERVSHCAVMNFLGGITSFDATTTRAASEEWEDSAKIYLQFTVDTSLVDGVASQTPLNEKSVKPCTCCSLHASRLSHCLFVETSNAKPHADMYNILSLSYQSSRLIQQRST